MSYLVYFAIVSISAGIVMTPVVILLSHRFGMDISRHYWILAIPVAFSLLLNVILVEIYGRYQKK